MNELTLDDIRTLFQQHGIDEKITHVRQLSGTTEGLVLKLDAERGESYILKFETPDEIRTVDGVSGTETFVYLRLHKQLYDWGTR